MKKIRSGFWNWAIIGVLLVSLTFVRAQTITGSGQSELDVMTILAQARALAAEEPVLERSIPVTATEPSAEHPPGTYWSLQNVLPPLPFDLFPELPIYIIDLTNRVFLVDDRSVDFVGLRAQQTQVEVMAANVKSMKAPMSGAGGTAGYFTPNFAPPDYGTNLYLECLTVSNRVVNGLIHNSAAPIPYTVFSRQSLMWPAWIPEATFYGAAETNVTLFSVAMLARDDLFLRAVSALAPRTIGAGPLHNVALKRDGTVWAWGANESGQLGNGSWEGSLFPSQVIGLSNIVAIAAPEEGYHVLALDAGGMVWGWGANDHGQLGQNDALYEDQNTAAPVAGLSNIVAIAGGWSHSVALKSDGTVWAWGYNGAGELGDGSTTERDYAAPVPGLTNAIVIASGSEHAFALCADGKVWGWGYNGNGELGIGNSVNQLQPVLISSLTNVVALSGGLEFSLALLSDGTVRAWGDNDSGELGNGTDESSLTPIPVTGLSNITAIACGGIHALALDASGTLWVWGDGYDGQLGNGVYDSIPTPFVLTSVSNVVAIGGGSYSSLAATADGKVYMWGLYGYLDNWDWNDRMMPMAYELENQQDTDNDGLPDWFETALGTATNNADSDGDGVSDYVEVVIGTGPLNPSDAPHLQLGFWKFDTTNWLGEAGQTPLTFTNVQSVPDWNGTALRVSTNVTAMLVYREIETNLSAIIRSEGPYGILTHTQANYSANITLRAGTIQFWFKPDWNSVSAGGTGPGTNAALIVVGQHSPDFTADFWGLEFDSNGDVLRFSSEGGGQQHVYFSAPVSFSSNQWYQITLAYKTNSSALYTNGQQAATGSGVQASPTQPAGFNIGSTAAGDAQAFGMFDNLETFNYSMTASEASTGFYQAATNATVQFPNPIVNSNGIFLTLLGVPAVTVAVLINDTNLANAVAQTYFGSTNVQVPVNLGTNDGIYIVRVGIWNRSGYTWTMKKIVMDTTPPVIVPAGQSVTTNFPLLQLIGYSTEALASIRFDVTNSQTTNLNQIGFVVKSDGKTFAGMASTNWLQCFDIKLAPGPNTIVLRCADLAGNVSTNVYSYTLETASMPTSTLSVEWPSDNTVVSGNKITVKGHISDPTATMVARVSQDGSTNDITGVVERDGTFWIDNVPLAGATNTLTITATDVANQSATNTLTVQSSPVVVTVDPVSGDALKGDTATVTGTIDSGGYNITVNGVAATVSTNLDGSIHWIATNVPVPAGGVATFRVQAICEGDPESLVYPDKPTYIRVSQYNESFNFQWLEYHDSRLQS